MLRSLNTLSEEETLQNRRNWWRLLPSLSVYRVHEPWFQLLFNLTPLDLSSATVNARCSMLQFVPAALKRYQLDNPMISKFGLKIGCCYVHHLAHWVNTLQGGPNWSWLTWPSMYVCPWTLALAALQLDLNSAQVARDQLWRSIQASLKRYRLDYLINPDLVWRLDVPFIKHIQRAWPNWWWLTWPSPHPSTYLCPWTFDSAALHLDLISATVVAIHSGGFERYQLDDPTISNHGSRTGSPENHMTKGHNLSSPNDTTFRLRIPSAYSERPKTHAMIHIGWHDHQATPLLAYVESLTLRNQTA